MYPEDGTIPQLAPNRYRSVNFIAHSLGGIVIPALIHTVKSERGHDDRSRFGFTITLGTPVLGAPIANVGLLAHEVIGGNDRLLKALELDNTYLRMMNYWRRAEENKANYFGCRAVTLDAAVEGEPMYGITIVPPESAVASLRSFNLARMIKVFSDRNHSSLAKPTNELDDVYQWVNGTIDDEFDRLSRWPVRGERPYLCDRSWLD
jgi:Putative serine esterase (DUF676)